MLLCQLNSFGKFYYIFNTLVRKRYSYKNHSKVPILYLMVIRGLTKLVKCVINISRKGEKMLKEVRLNSVTRLLELEFGTDIQMHMGIDDECGYLHLNNLTSDDLKAIRDVINDYLNGLGKGVVMKDRIREACGKQHDTKGSVFPPTICPYCFGCPIAAIAVGILGDNQLREALPIPSEDIEEVSNWLDRI